MPTERDLADASIEAFADTCVKLAARDGDRVAVLGESGLSEERWSLVSAAWGRRLRGTSDEARGLAERFGKSYGAQIAPVPQDIAHATAPAPSLASAGPLEPPPLLTPTFLLPPEPPPVRARGESPWACTVPLEGVACRAALPFHAAASPPAAATGTGARAPMGASTGTVALRDLVAPREVTRPGAPASTGTVALRDLKGPPARSPEWIAPPRSAPVGAVDDEDTERTVMAPPAVRARPLRRN